MAEKGDGGVVPARPMTGDVSTHTTSDSEGAGTKFNEQTNYVPVKTIITVWPGKLIAKRRMLMEADLSGVRQCRFGGVDGPNYTRCQFIHYRCIFWIHERGFLDRKWLLHVSRPVFADVDLSNRTAAALLRLDN